MTLPRVLLKGKGSSSSDGGCEFVALCVPGCLSERSVYLGDLPKTSTEELLKVMFPLANDVHMRNRPETNSR
jgi:hypothetical protein